MGNYVSCASSRAPSNAVKVVHTNGRVEQFHRRIRAAELMLENALQFVCHSNALHIGRHVQPLSADEELEMGSLYFLLPMHKLHTALSTSDMASLAFKAKVNSRKSSKILPVLEHSRPLIDNFGGEFNVLVMLPRTKLGNLPEQSMAPANHRMGSCRSWKPKLETISEASLLRCSTLKN